MTIASKKDMRYNLKQIIIIASIAVLHIFMSLSISIYHGNLAGKKVGFLLSKSIKQSEFKENEIQNLNVNFKNEVRSTYYLSFVLSLPFGPALRPLQQKWIYQPILNNEIGQKQFNQRTQILAAVGLFSNGFFFSLVFFFILKALFILRRDTIKKMGA